MTYEAALSLPEDAQASFIQKIFGGIFGFFNSLAVRLVVIFLIGALATAAATDFVYPKLVPGFSNKLVIELASGAKRRMPTSQEILLTMNQYNLAWYYITSADGKVNPATKPYAPVLPSYGIVPRELDWKGKHYWESVESLDGKSFLHIGLYAGQSFIPVLSTGELAATAPVSLGWVSILVPLLMFLTMVSLQVCVSKPLHRLFRACYSLLLAREAYSHVTGGGLNVPGAVTEVQMVSKGLREIRRQYDESIAAKAAKDEELKKQRSEFAEEKTFISRQYEDQLAQSEAKLTELHTKEAEEEFINSLGREIDNLKSSKQVYHRVLEKLNDKFPTSIIFGAFFKVSKTFDTTVDAYLGFDDRSLQVLKKIDHTSIAREILGSGQYKQITTSTMRELGFQQLAQNNTLRHIVYMPVRFQNRNLGMLAFYFVQEGQTVQERLRVLRNVVDLTARTLYQVVLYEEETEASRTDPMTGLRNKKFFYELMPQVFERASAKPEQNPISLIMIDGDHFKSINDTYGHQVGDQMLQELSKTIKSCVRTEDSSEKASGPGDYLIRYGGEEFLIVMEMTDKARAVSVAERIRVAVEEKHDWPGGIVKWTISLGVATYPADGKNAEDLMGKADNALYYVKEELGRNKVCHSQAVPRSYKGKAKAAAIGGELGVFDAAGLLQSIATSQKTGVLTVRSGEGKQLWMLWEIGKPIQARIGKIQGRAAISEFLVCFEEADARFDFKELPAGAKLPKLEDTCNVTGALESCLMGAALAQDNYNAAKTVISSTDIFVRPVAQEEFNAKWAALGQLGEDAPSPDEFNAMTEIVKRCNNGGVPLTQIFKGMEQNATPTHVMWRGAALLVQHGLVQTKAA